MRIFTDGVWSIAVAMMAGIGQFHVLVELAPRWAAIGAAVLTTIVIAFEMADYAAIKRREGR